MPSIIKALGYLGLVPFIYLAIVTWLPAVNVFSLNAAVVFRFYSAVILSFMAGALWPLAFLKVSPEKAGAAVSVNPRIAFTAIGFSLLAWGAILMGMKAALFVLGVAFIALWKTEENIGVNGYYPQWYQWLRAQLTVTVAVCHIVVWLAVE
ncbi:DUF3429 domain-containing protein [Flocculibacter collagenilyticus]|uniref:DUF3429 domain-containing protein n=1 Tax=Flocculibacter collagenilyticus TaxID=2744479 RepID=UPI0018F69DE6|nr:DUF3429 domain-containing protein [Flocculibacter collagenilyticus]